MTEVARSTSWRDEIMSLVEEDSGVIFTDESMEISNPNLEAEISRFTVGLGLGTTNMLDGESVETESFKDQVKGFARAWGEIVLELGKGVKDIVQQTLLTDDSYVVLKLKKPIAKASSRLRFFNDYLPEDRDPVHSWSVIFCVFFLALAVLTVNIKHNHAISLVKKMSTHPSSATRIQLPDGRYMAYLEQGLSCSRARQHLIASHSFLSSRLAGIPGVKESLLEEFGIHLVTYDLPGFGESDPHPKRNLTSSAFDMLYLANAVGIKDKFWVLGFSSGAMHAWAALKYIPDQIQGAAMFSPMINPFDTSMTKEEMSRTWDGWLRRRKMMHYLARSFPKFLSYIYRKSFLSGKHGRLDNWLSWTLGNKDKSLIDDPRFEEFWHRDIEESIRQGNVKPFVEESLLQVTDWGFKLTDLAVRNKCPNKGFLTWFKFLSTEDECESIGFKGPIHIWQGLDDQVVPPSMIDYVTRVLPNVVVHKIPNEGHFSYFFLCDECHRQIFLTLFGSPNETDDTDQGDRASFEEATDSNFDTDVLHEI
ncbi:uncharacterized protein LOC124920118 [Impatiens glandulifera]|uniref:uncharacterized protein LOC124920118 n=1 Tax=Impatiens glandulifera TaxID=253017 RepID=UPI001FB1790D|nr:uncharacterized protein LOC124920118 [Impatiens glandulifera]XP_047316488.1 uncharacterized protein LOC124920118 [Impatiens glandulifera]